MKWSLLAKILFAGIVISAVACFAGFRSFEDQFPLGAPSDLPKISKAAFVGDVPKMERLLDQGDDINGLDSGKRNALWWAINNEEYAAADYLISKGITVNNRSNDGLTILEYCQTMKLAKPVKWLREHLKSPSKPKTP